MGYGVLWGGIGGYRGAMREIYGVCYGAMEDVWGGYGGGYRGAMGWAMGRPRGIYGRFMEGAIGELWGGLWGH